MKVIHTLPFLLKLKTKRWKRNGNNEAVIQSEWTFLHSLNRRPTRAASLAYYQLQSVRWQSLTLSTFLYSIHVNFIPVSAYHYRRWLLLSQLTIIVGQHIYPSGVEGGSGERKGGTDTKKNHYCYVRETPLLPASTPDKAFGMFLLKFYFPWRVEELFGYRTDVFDGINSNPCHPEFKSR